MVSQKEQLAENVKVSVAAEDEPVGEGEGNEPRLLYHQTELDTTIRYEKPPRNYRGALRQACKCTPLAFLYRTVPILYWLPRYPWRQAITGDIISGITVAIMNIPQGMGYGLLGNVAPVVGIYMAFFPVLMYAIFGTSRHVSIGTFGVVCLMTGKVVAHYGTDAADAHRSDLDEEFPIYTNLQVAITVSFTVAMIQFAMYLFRLGIVVNLLSETLVNGLTCACAFHVLGTQLKDLFGLSIVKRRGYFSLPLTFYDAVLAVPGSNRAAVYVSIFCILCMVINNEFIKPRVAKKTRIPIPIELMVVVIGTAVSYLADFQNRWNITIVGDLPTGFPEPAMPEMKLIRFIFKDALLIALISYVITMSMALILAQKKVKYDIDGNQELLAMGIANTVGSIFSCMPITASLSRSVIQQTVGGSTQLASVVSCFLLMFVLLWIGPVFSFLPKCCLASIIVVALKSLYMQVRQVPAFWRASYWDGLLWLVTFFTTTIVAIDVGLAAGAVFSLASICYQGQCSYTCLLGNVPNTDLYLDVVRFHGAREIPGLKIFHYSGALNFVTRAYFKKRLLDAVDLTRNVRVRTKSSRDTTSSGPPLDGIDSDGSKLMPLLCVILDFSALTYIDPSGLNLLRTIQGEIRAKHIEFYLAGCSGQVYEALRLADLEANRAARFQVFPRVHDAVVFAKMTVFPIEES